MCGHLNGLKLDNVDNDLTCAYSKVLFILAANFKQLRSMENDVLWYSRKSIEETNTKECGKMRFQSSAWKIINEDFVSSSLIFFSTFFFLSSSVIVRWRPSVNLHLLLRNRKSLCFQTWSGCSLRWIDWDLFMASWNIQIC